MDISPRQKSRQIHQAYVSGLREKGIELTVGDREVVYITKSGKTVGMPYASEKAKRPDRWFLGLPDRHYDSVVLLCETMSGLLLDFILPPDVVSEIWASLSRDSNGQVKFEVFRRRYDDVLKVPGMNEKRIRSFVGAHEILAQ